MVSFADRDGWIWLDGALVPWRAAQLHVLSHGLHYGSSVFEGERAYNGRVFALSRHSDRLRESARHLGFEVPYGIAVLDRATRDVVAANDIRDGYVRPVAWCGSENLAITARENAVHVAIAAWPWPHVFSADARAAGIALGTSTWRRPAPNTAPVQAKAAGLYEIGTLARRAAESGGYDDALLLDYRGYLAEATGANLFLVIDGALHTPICDCFLDGITRRSVIDQARALGIRVVERHLEPVELAYASEIFLTGTAYEVQPVRRVDHREFVVGPVTRALMATYDELVRAPDTEAAHP
jgi:branched-chain amino acid aminotransferase